MADEFLKKKYQKWDHFEDSDSENEAAPLVPTQFDTQGDEDIVVSDEMLLTPEQVAKLRKVELKRQEIWQIVVRKLRVWSASSKGAAEGSDAIPCRPYCILVNNLYPLGNVVSKRIVDPPEVYPSPEMILDMAVHTMLDPPTSTPQHRPDKLVFPDKHYVGKLRKSLAAINIECTYLSESEGIDAYIKELSKHLVQKDFASVAEVSERPGLVSGEGVTPEVLAPFYEACAHYARLTPWKRVAERQAIQIDADKEIRVGKHSAGHGSIFASVIGSPSSEGPIHGMALFFSRADLERRVLPPGEKLAMMENPRLRRCALCDKRAPHDKELKRCTRCQCTFYCDAQCQRGHWKQHKISCVPPAQAEAQAAAAGGATTVWGAKEMTVLFGPETSMPFNDLDAIDVNNYAVATVNGEHLYPSPVVFAYGEPQVPSASDLLWLTRGLLAIIEVAEKHPLFLQETMEALIGTDEESASEEDATTDDKQPTLEVSCNTLGVNEQLVVRNSTVLTMQDVAKLREYLAKRKVASTTEKDDQADDQAAETATGEQDRSQCSVM